MFKDKNLFWLVTGSIVVLALAGAAIWYSVQIRKNRRIEAEKGLLGHCGVNYANWEGGEVITAEMAKSKGDGQLPPYSLRGNGAELDRRLAIIRAEAQRMGYDIDFSSLYRSVRHNANITGAASESSHVCFKAADIRPVGFSASALKSLILRLISEGRLPDGGVGTYNSWIHYDIAQPRRW